MQNADLNFTLLEGTTKGLMFQIINSLIESWEVCLKCRDCDNSLFDSSIVLYGGLNPPLTAILSTHLFMFSASHFQSVQELIFLQRAEKWMFSKRQNRQKKKKDLCT